MPPSRCGTHTEGVASVVKALIIVVAIVVLLLVAIWGFQRRLIYFPDSATPPPAESVLPGAEDIVLVTSDGLELGAWFIPAEATADRQLAVLVAPGNGGHRSARAPLARALAARGFSVLLFDYRGYGGNPGSPSEEGLARDVRAARRYLVEDAGVPPHNVLYFGESLGTAVVTELATEHPPAALVLRSPFVDLASVGRTHYPFLPVGLLLRDRFPLRDHLRTVTVPTTVVYGTSDSIVPAEQSRAVARAASHLHQVIAIRGAGHNDQVLLYGDELVDAVVDIVTDLGDR